MAPLSWQQVPCGAIAGEPGCHALVFVFFIAIWLALLAGPAAAQAYERAQLGVTVTDLTADDLADFGGGYSGAYVTNVLPEGPAWSSGIRPFDLIVALDAQATPTTHELVCQILARHPGDQVSLTIVRARKPLTISATLARWPKEDAERVPVRDCGRARVSGLPRDTQSALALR